MPHPITATTNAAEVRVRNVYRHFRDRQAIMATLAERMNSRIESAIADIAGPLSQDRPLKQVVDDLVEQVMMAAAAEPAAVQVRAAMRTSRELQAIDAASDRRIAHLLAGALRQRGVRARRDRLEASLSVLVTAIGPSSTEPLWTATKAIAPRSCERSSGWLTHIFRRWREARRRRDSGWQRLTALRW
jgi:AcrR family transcriptional regulator